MGLFFCCFGSVLGPFLSQNWGPFRVIFFRFWACKNNWGHWYCLSCFWSLWLTLFLIFFSLQGSLADRAGMTADDERAFLTFAPVLPRYKAVNFEIIWTLMFQWWRWLQMWNNLPRHQQKLPACSGHCKTLDNLEMFPGDRSWDIGQASVCKHQFGGGFWI